MNTSKTRAKTAGIINSYSGELNQNQSQNPNQNHYQNQYANTNQGSSQNQNSSQNAFKQTTFLPLCPPRNEHAVKFITFPSTVPVTAESQQNQWLSSPVPVPKMSHSARRFAKSTPILVSLSCQANPNPPQKITSLVNSPVLQRRNIRSRVNLSRYQRNLPSTNLNSNSTAIPGNSCSLVNAVTNDNVSGNSIPHLKPSLKKPEDNPPSTSNSKLSKGKFNKNEIKMRKNEKALKAKDTKKGGENVSPIRNLRDQLIGGDNPNPAQLTACLVPVKSGGGNNGVGNGPLSTSTVNGSFMGERMQVIRTDDEKIRNADTIRLDKCGLKQFPLITPSSEPHLKLLSLQHNQITRLENVPALSHLVVLDIYDNRIEKIAGLQGLNSLRVLLLGKNRIRRIEGLEGLRRLEILDLHGNQLRYVDNLGCLTSLRVLNLAGNNFKTIRLGPSNLVSLTELNLKRNRIRNLEGLQKAPHLKKLLLANNELSSAACLWPLRKLVFLQEILFEPNQLCLSPDYISQILTIFPWLDILDRNSITDQQRQDAKVWHRKRLAEDEEKKKKIDQVKLRATAVPITREEIILQARRRWQSVKNFVKQASNSNSVDQPTTADLGENPASAILSTSTTLTSKSSAFDPHNEKEKNKKHKKSTNESPTPTTALSSMSRILFPNFHPDLAGPALAEIVHKEPLTDFDIEIPNQNNNNYNNSDSSNNNAEIFDTDNDNNGSSFLQSKSTSLIPINKDTETKSVINAIANAETQQNAVRQNLNSQHSKIKEDDAKNSNSKFNIEQKQHSSQTDRIDNKLNNIEPTLSTKFELEAQLDSQTALSDDNENEKSFIPNSKVVTVSKPPSILSTTPKSSRIAVVRPLLRNQNHIRNAEEELIDSSPIESEFTVKTNINNDNSNFDANANGDDNAKEDSKICKSSHSQITPLKDLLEAQQSLLEEDAITDSADDIVEEDQLFPVIPESDSISCLIENQPQQSETTNSRNDLLVQLNFKHFKGVYDEMEEEGEENNVNNNDNLNSQCQWDETQYLNSQLLQRKEHIDNNIKTELNLDQDIPEINLENENRNQKSNFENVLHKSNTEVQAQVQGEATEIDKDKCKVAQAKEIGSRFKRSASLTAPADSNISNLSLTEINEAENLNMENIDDNDCSLIPSMNDEVVHNVIKDTLQVPGQTSNKNKLALMKNLRSQSFDVRYPGYDVSSDSESSDGTSSFMTTNTSETGTGRSGVNRKFFPRNKTRVKRDRLLSSKNQGGYSSGRRPYTGIRDSNPNRGTNPNRPLKRCDSAISDLSPALSSATMKKQGTDYLVEIDGRILNIYGQGALKYTMMGFPASLTSHVTTAKFHYITFDTLIPFFGKLRQIYPSLEHFQFRANNLTTLSQLNALGDLQGLTSLHIVKEGNPLFANELWPNYAAYRLSHWGLQSINGKQISSQSNYRGETAVISSVSAKSFESLGYVALSCLPQTALTPLAKKLHTLHCFCCCSPSGSSDDSGRRGKGGVGNEITIPTATGLNSPGTAGQHTCTAWDDDPVLLDVIGKEALVYAPPPLLPDTNQVKLKERAEIPVKILNTGVEILEKLDLLEKIWPSLLSEVVQDILMDYLLMDNYMKKELKKLQDIALISKNKLP